MDIYQGQSCKYLSMYQNVSTLQLPISVTLYIGGREFQSARCQVVLLQLKWFL